jgi:hypothetical protein
MGYLRKIVFHAEDNGLERCIIRIQRRVLIDVEAFGDWLESHRAGAALSLHSEMKTRRKAAPAVSQRGSPRRRPVSAATR